MEDKTKTIDKQTVLKGLRFAVMASLLISAIIIFMTIDEDSFHRFIDSIDPIFISYLLIIMLLNWFTAGLRLKIMVNIVGDQISLKDGMIVYLAGAFVSHVTPFASGGGPFQVYFLHKKGVNIGKSSTVIVAQFVLRLFFFGIATPIFLIFFNSAVSPGVVPPVLFYLAFGFGILVSVGIIVFTMVPGIADGFFAMILKINKLNNFIKNSHKAKRWLVKGRQELKEFRASLRILRSHKWGLFLGTMLTVIFWSLLFMIMPLVLQGLGMEANFFKAYVMQTILYLVLPYMPTPGASGIAEVGFASLFVSFIPRNYIGLVTFAWRLFSFHLVLLVGGIFALREIGKNRDNQS